MFVAIVLLALLAFANGANDVSKGIATLAGSGVTDTRRAVLWGTLWTIVGSLAGIFLGLKLVATFSNGIYAGNPSLTSALSLALSVTPALWVLLATRFGWPVSTTHAITGGLLGAGLAAFGWSGIAWNSIFVKIILPLLMSPFISMILTYLLTSPLQWCLAKMENQCVCLAPVPRIVPLSHLGVAASAIQAFVPVRGTQETCVSTWPHLSIKSEWFHWVTSGIVSLARGLNDTPKVIAVVLPITVLSNLSSQNLFIAAAFFMGLGSWLGGRKITDVLGFRITRMNHFEGFSANLVTALLVILASPLGLPVSTTHVSSSAIMGVGIASGKGLQWKTVREMLMAWVLTVPGSASIGMLLFMLIRRFS